MTRRGGRLSRSAQHRPQPTQKAPTAKRPTHEHPPKPAPAQPAEPFRLGAIPGATPGKWIQTWRERAPADPLELLPLTLVDQRETLLSGTVDAALVRLPIDRDGLHVIPLYEETAVVVMAAEHNLATDDELELAQIAAEQYLIPDDAVFPTAHPDPSLRMRTGALSTAEAIATAATGAGIVIVPMSLARLHNRGDVTWRPLRDGPRSAVALAWVAERTTAPVELFVGIVRGRTPNSSR